MSVELITYGSDRRLELGAAEAIRPMVYLDDWTRMRIGLQLSFDGALGNITGTPFFSFGVCSGSTNALAASTATHVVGVRQWGGVGTTPQATWVRSAGPPSYFNISNGGLPFTKVGATIAYGAAFSGFGVHVVNAPAQRSGIFLDIIKGSPNFTFQLAFPVNSTAASSDLTDAEFLAMMELSTLDTVSAAKTNYERVSGGATAVDEATNGALNHLFVYWDRTTHKVSFNIRHRKIS